VEFRTTRRPHWGRVIFYSLTALTAAWLAWAGRAIWFPVSIAFVIAMVLDPTVDRLENRGFSRGLATGLVFLLFVLGGVLAVVLLSPGVSAQASAMATDLGRLFPDPERPDLVPVTQKLLDRLNAQPALRDALLEAAREATHRLSLVLERAADFVLAWAPNLAWFIVVPVLAFYILMDFHRIYAKAILLIPPRHRPFSQSLIAEITAVLGHYLRGLALLCGSLGVVIAAVLFAYGNPYWQLLGLLGGLLYAVPVAGSMFTLALVFLVTLVTASPGKALLAGGTVLLVTSGLYDQIITPRVLGRQVGLHPILTILALLLGFQVAGIAGMLVAVPITAIVQLVVIHLIPKLGTELELRPLEELKRTEEATRAEHLEAEEEAADEHFHLQTVVENVETLTAEREAA
jgi:predicted PurR-regulated permease PerM